MDTTGQIKVESEDIFPIIKKWLYSEPDIFLRELIANATDAITKRTVLSTSLNLTLPDPKITVKVENKTITFTDNGLGMTKDEVENYITRLAFSGATEFIKQLEANKNAEIIGKFGLGFFSAFMVASKVELESLSYKEGSTPIKWTCEGSTNYTFSESELKEIGTKITLHINDESKEFLETTKLKDLLHKYCNFMPYPIFLDTEQINDTNPIWHQNAKDLTDENYLKFFEKLYPFEEAPLFWIHLKVDHPFTLEGILYFPKIDYVRQFKDTNISLYSKQVFVSNDVKKIIPDFLSLLKGVIDSPDIPLNVSRSSLQGDPNVEKISNYVVKKAGEELKKLFKNDRKKYETIWPSISLFVKYGVVTNDKFAHLMSEFLLFKSSDDNLITIKELQELNKDVPLYKEKLTGKTIYFEKNQTHLKEELKKLGITTIETDAYADPHLLQHLEIHDKIQFHACDSALALLTVPSSGETDNTLKEIFKNALGEIELDINNLPAFTFAAYLKEDEQMRRFMQMSKAMNAPSTNFNVKKTLVLNPSHPLLQNILRIKDADLTKKMCQYVYDMAMMTAPEVTDQSRQDFIKNGQELLVKLTSNL